MDAGVGDVVPLNHLRTNGPRPPILAQPLRQHACLGRDLPDISYRTAFRLRSSKLTCTAAVLVLGMGNDLRYLEPWQDSALTSFVHVHPFRAISGTTSFVCRLNGSSSPRCHSRVPKRNSSLLYGMPRHRWQGVYAVCCYNSKHPAATGLIWAASMCLPARLVVDFGPRTSPLARPCRAGSWPNSPSSCKQVRQQTQPPSSQPSMSPDAHYSRTSTWPRAQCS